MNVAEIEVQLADLVRERFDTSEFAFRVLEIYNAPKATVTKLRNGTQKKGDQAGDVFWSRKAYFRAAADGQAAATLDTLKDGKATKSQKPRFLIATDGHEVAAYDTKADDTLYCDYDKLNDHFDFFLPLAGVEKYEAVAENPADIKAAGRLAKLHDEIERHNPDWLVPERRHALNQFLTRMLFCMFAEDTGSFPPDLFVKTVSEFGGSDGEYLQSLLKQIFDAMNLPPEDRRQDLPPHIRAFPYVNGGLFADSTDVPAFNKRAKRMLVEAAQLDWREINPDIFGSMIQAVVHPDMRGDLGMHYTSVPNIMKVLQPLFLMSLEEEFDRARGHREERSLLRKVLARISKIRVFDPACGSGNFLIIAYRELRTLEMRIFQRLDEMGGGTTTWREQSAVKLSNFYGIELADFAAETAKLSLWIAEYQMNQRFKSLFGEAPNNFPLRDGGQVVCGNALRLDWLKVCPPATQTVQKEKIFDLARIEKVHATERLLDDEVETYVVGNPPYLGRADQTELQKEDMKLCFADLTANYKGLDYVASWYVRYLAYQQYVRSESAFVATSSICQGEQVPALWPLLLSDQLEISFAHTPFKWSNNASANAAVSCVIIGLTQKKNRLSPKRIIGSEHARVVKAITPYLTEGETVYVHKRRDALALPFQMSFGSMPNDGGHLLLTKEEMEELTSRSPPARQFLRRIIGSREFANGTERWCLWIDDGNLADAVRIPAIKTRVDAVRVYRLNSDRPETVALAKTPHRFGEVRHTDREGVIVPSYTSERREYITAGFVEQNWIVSNLAFCARGAEPYLLSLISSKMHYVWGCAVGGRFKTDPRYSATLVYNTFPVPLLNSGDKTRLDEHAWSIIGVREAYPGKTIAWLYDPETMPKPLLDAHQALDDTLEKIYIGRPFNNDTERLEHLFNLYADATSGKQQEVVHA